MKRIITTLLLFIIAFNTQAQKGMFFGAGYNLSNSPLKVYSRILERYNETRSWLDIPLNEPNKMRGITVAWGSLANNVLYEMRWVGRHVTNHAEGTDNSGKLISREMKLRNNTFMFSFGVIPITNRVFSTGFGWSFDFSSVKVFTRVDEAALVKQTSFEKVFGSGIRGWGSTIFVPLYLNFLSGSGIMLEVRPYYQFYFNHNDFLNVDAAINSSTYLNDRFPTRDRMNNYGVQFMIDLRSKNN